VQSESKAARQLEIAEEGITRIYSILISLPVSVLVDSSRTRV
jgi:hypothetical protein